LILPLALLGCSLQSPQALHPPSSVSGGWALDAATDTLVFPFSATTVVQRSGISSIDLGELYRVAKLPVTETITDSLYLFGVQDQAGYSTYRFAKVDENTVNLTIGSSVSTVGPVPMHRL